VGADLDEIHREAVAGRVVGLDHAPAERNQRRREVLGVGPALLGVLGERLVDHALERLGRVGAVEAQRRRRVVLHLARELGERGGIERPHAGKHLVEHHAERVEVGARIAAIVAAQALGRRIGRRADERPRRREALVARHGAEQRREAEVEQLHERTVAEAHDQHEVGRLEVAVQDAAVVCGLQPGQRVRGHRAGHLDVERAVGVDGVGQRAAAQVLHDQVRLAVGLAEVVDVDDVGVADGGRRLGLAQEALHGCRVGRRRRVQ
jgi:hypothetical protein